MSYSGHVFPQLKPHASEAVTPDASEYSAERSGLSDRALNAREQAELEGHTEIARLLEDAEAESNGSA